MSWLCQETRIPRKAGDSEGQKSRSWKGGLPILAERSPLGNICPKVGVVAPSGQEQYMPEGAPKGQRSLLDKKAPEGPGGGLLR